MVRNCWSTGAWFVLSLVFANAIQSNAVVIRHDVPDSKYLVPAGEIPALVDLPSEGHGVLISSQWVVTVAHAVRNGMPTQVFVLGRARKVAKMVVYPGFKYPTDGQLKMTGDAAPLMATFAALDDIALLKLEQPIDNVNPVPLYKGNGEQGALVRIYGKGATGNGLVGQYPNSPHRGQLRRAYNYVTSADGKWLGYRFDEGAQGHPLEGMLGDGDSGGPVLMKVNGADELVGLSDRKAWTGDLAGFRPGIYGMYSYQVRISHFAPWIESVIAENSRM